MVSSPAGIVVSSPYPSLQIPLTPNRRSPTGLGLPNLYFAPYPVAGSPTRDNPVVPGIRLVPIDADPVRYSRIKSDVCGWVTLGASALSIGGFFWLYYATKY